MNPLHKHVALVPAQFWCARLLSGLRPWAPEPATLAAATQPAATQPSRGK